jgi:hypothetical protein
MAVPSAVVLRRLDDSIARDLRKGFDTGRRGEFRVAIRPSSISP